MFISPQPGAAQATWDQITWALSVLTAEYLFYMQRQEINFWTKLQNWSYSAVFHDIDLFFSSASSYTVSY